MGYKVTFDTRHKVHESDEYQRSCWDAVGYWSREMADSRVWADLQRTTRNYCHAMDQYYELFGDRFAGGEWLDRRDVCS
jgi:hypothetical protein